MKIRGTQLMFEKCQECQKWSNLRQIRIQKMPTESKYCQNPTKGTKTECDHFDTFDTTLAYFKTFLKSQKCIKCRSRESKLCDRSAKSIKKDLACVKFIKTEFEYFNFLLTQFWHFFRRFRSVRNV